MPSSRPSSSSDTRVMPSRPTIESAPCAWCRCDWLDFSCAASALFAANARSPSWARWIAWSISPLTQESGPTSKSARAVIAPRPGSPASTDLEARHRTFQLLGELGELADRHRRALGALGGLLSDAQNVLHAGRHGVSGSRLLFGGQRNAFNEVGELLRHRSDLGKRLARCVRELRAFDHTLRALLHGGDRDRKSTRLNSSHMSISYAVFCLKKKKKKIHIILPQKKKNKK